MNVSQVEDWARSNNRQPEHYENGSTTSSGETTVNAATRYLAPLVQLLQWLQCFTSTKEDHASLLEPLMQMQRLTPMQLIHAVKNYRFEVGEKGLAKAHMKFLQQLQKGSETLIRRPVTPVRDTDTPNTPVKGSTPQASGRSSIEKTTTPVSPNPKGELPAQAPTSHPSIESDTDPPIERNRLLLALHARAA